MHVLALVLWATTAEPEAAADVTRAPLRFGVGASVGDPTGVSAKLLIRNRHGLQVEAGWAPMHTLNGGVVHLSYLFHLPTFVRGKRVDFGMYLGAGVGAGFFALQGPYYRYGDRTTKICDPDPTPDSKGDCFNLHPATTFIVRTPVGFFVQWKRRPLDLVLEGAWSPVLWERMQLARGDVSVKMRWWIF